MRPGSNNKRMRGRNRRGPNPLSRSYESNGPDVKVRGTAQHIADRYLQLARDAQSSGDPITAEGYLQHAEHYLRIIAAAQEQLQGQYGYRPRPDASSDEDGEGDDGEGMPQANGQGGEFQGQPRQQQHGQDAGETFGEDDPQPPMFSGPRFENRNQRFEQREGWNRPNRQDNQRQDNQRQDNNRQDNQRNDAHRQDGRQDGPRQDYNRQDSRPDHNRQDHNRQDHNNRRDAPREGANGQGETFSEPQGEPRPYNPNGGPREDGYQRGPDQRRFQGQPGGGRDFDRPRRERFERGPRPVAPPIAEVEQALPSFITAPPRVVPVAADAVPDVTPAVVHETVSAPTEDAVAARPKRGRPRRVPDAVSPAEGAEAPAEDTSPILAK